jgi:hypothetical protein
MITGGYRVFDKTWKIIKENLVIPNNAKLFIFVESPYLDEEFQAKMKSFFGEYLGTAKTLESTRTYEYNKIVEFLLQQKQGLEDIEFNRVGVPKQYITQSGSILEYYQFMKCYDLILEYERRNNVRFDLFMRTRPDIPVLTTLAITDFFKSVDHDKLEKYGREIYVRSMGNDIIARKIQDGKNTLQNFKEGYDPFRGLDLDDDDLLRMINEEEFIWTIYYNWIWIAKRHVMQQLYPMIYFYGDFWGEKYAYASESQFREYLCRMNCRVLTYWSTSESSLWGDNETKSAEIIRDNGILNPDIDQEAIATLMRR